MAATHLVAATEDDRQQLEQPRCPFGPAERVVDVFGEVARNLDVVGHPLTGGLPAEAAVEHRPVDAHIVDRVDQPGRVQPVVVRRRPRFASRVVQDPGRLAIHHERHPTGVQREAPVRPPGAEGEALGGEAKRLLDERRREAHEPGRLVHLGAGFRQDSSSLLAVDAHAHLGQYLQGALVDLRPLVARQNLQQRVHDRLRPRRCRAGSMATATPRLERDACDAAASVPPPR